MIFEIVVFGFSLALLCLFFGFKYWEIKRRRVLFPEVRRKADEAVSEHSQRLYERSLRASRRFSERARYHGTQKTNQCVEEIRHTLEHILAYLLDKIRRKNKLKKRGRASDYLVHVGTREEEKK
ncbi:MAG: hypothetical protein WDZ90_02180 [Candidatus Paceibacterota bacterium]